LLHEMGRRRYRRVAPAHRAASLRAAAAAAAWCAGVTTAQQCPDAPTGYVSSAPGYLPTAAGANHAQGDVYYNEEYNTGFMTTAACAEQCSGPIGTQRSCTCGRAVLRPWPS
jgi:hypothetical protein